MTIKNPDRSLYNKDLAPTLGSERTWSKWHIASLWVGMAVCIPTYGLAAGLVALGASLKLAVLSVAIGNVIVLLPLILNGHPGAKYGIPFPVLIRSSFGPLGAHIPTMIRALVACGWFGIQTWIGGEALHLLASSAAPEVYMKDFMPDWIGISTGQFVAFVLFWAINVAIIKRGINTLKVFETYAAPFLLLTGAALLVWAGYKVGFGNLLTDHSDKVVGGSGGGAGRSLGTFSALGIGITGAVAFWGTLALNIPDFTRYAKSQRAQAIGQAISLPTTMTFFVFIGAVVTNATILIFEGQRIDNLSVLLSQMGGTFTTFLALFGLIIATLSTNLAANVVSPANGFSNLWPSQINFTRGAVLTALIGLVIMPWKMWTDAAAYVSAWLGGCGSLLGAVGGIMIVDYFVLRKTELDVGDLYIRGGRYEFKGGFNPIAILALAIGIAPLLPGFLASIGVGSASGFLADLYTWSWFVSFFLAGAVYYAGMVVTGGARAAQAARSPSPAGD